MDRVKPLGKVYAGNEPDHFGSDRLEAVARSKVVLIAGEWGFPLAASTARAHLICVEHSQENNDGY